MKPITLQNYAEGRWVAGSGAMAELRSAVTGDVVALTSSQGLDFAAMLRFAREQGGPALRALTFHDRARMLKALAEALTARKEELYELSYNTGATKGDSWIDIDGGIGTFAVYQGKGRRELPNDTILIDGNVEALSRNGTFQGLHVFTSLQGAAVHINAFNFPGLGHAGKARADVPRRRPGHREARERHRLSRRSRRAHHAGGERAAEGRAAAGRRIARRSVRSPDLAGRDLLHRLCRNRSETQEPSRHPARKRALRGRAGLSQRLRARPRRRARQRRVRTLHQGSGERDDGESGAEVYRHSSRHGPGRLARCGAGGIESAPGEDRNRRSARGGNAYGRARQRRTTQRCARQDQRDFSRRADRLWRSGRGHRQPQGRLHLAGADALRTALGRARRARRGSVRPGVDADALYGRRRRRSLSPIAARGRW